MKQCELALEPKTNQSEPRAVEACPLSNPVERCPQSSVEAPAAEPVPEPVPPTTTTASPTDTPITEGVEEPKTAVAGDAVPEVPGPAVSTE